VNATAGALLREWRQRRRYSQLELAHRADVSAKHLSYVETGRSRPSPEMVLHLCQHLDVPLRERNRLLLAAGHAPRFAEQTYDPAADSDLSRLVDLILAAHRYPAAVIDPSWNLVATNAPFDILTEGLTGELLPPPVNLLRLSLDPSGLAPRIVNFDEYAGQVVRRLRHLVGIRSDPVLAGLLAEFGHLDAGTSTGPDAIDTTPGIVLPLVISHGDEVLRLVSTAATFGMPREVTLSELAIEAFYPADAPTRLLLDGLSA